MSEDENFSVDIKGYALDPSPSVAARLEAGSDNPPTQALSSTFFRRLPHIT
jgi:hypothetical protein